MTQPEEKSCFHGCPGCTKCADYNGRYQRCVECYPDNDWCDCPNGIIRWKHRGKHHLILLRLGRSPYRHGIITVTGREAIAAEKEFEEYQKEMDEYRHRRPRMTFSF